ncbi:phosphoribosylaminoimidazolesuccinocarboxamide synthase [Fulvivirga sedimenti]|uniref:Phosphoribosylaminoimidazole-succinocarboxamide synthase n=1 Tax=Fulvivirga sedimenti TaxID=2879465 RepID=A0A9X1HJY8_9BACT|nr:phosphoribosylaminoimidazolesuccinocarboxamide synthase [Fulvivirga sedimenti]MCA6073513.1 phosphoribosylaminoimidazolesuccinocarboxamide synthase [Fulvivirga sedimenti]
MNALKETNFKFHNQDLFYRGKVRDVYYFGEYMAMVATDRISAFDVILPEAIPFKGQVLNQIARQNLQMTRDICPNWLLSSPDPNVAIGLKCEPYKVEMVIRGYLAGHAWREYRDGKREICGVPMPDGLKENDKLPEPIITPTTKAMEGHDEDISRREILDQHIVPASEYEVLENYTRKLFARGTEIAAKQGLILVDTKYEFGKYGEDIFLIDEVHTPDSSRYFYSDGFEERQRNSEPQKQLSKEFVRQWLISEGFQGKEGQRIPEMTPEVVNSISGRYLELYEKFTGEALDKQDYSNVLKRIEEAIDSSINKLTTT